MTQPVSRGLWAVVLLGTAFEAISVIGGDRGDSSALWFLAPLLMGVFILGLWRYGRCGPPPAGATSSLAGRRRAALLFIGGSWLTGMVYELALRTGPTGFGGMAPETGHSFLLAQGYYVPFAVGGWWLAHRYGYSFAGVFWTGALSCLYEAITAGGVAVAGQPSLLLLAPLMAGYYLTVYGYILALPLLVLDERRLWSAAPRQLSPWRKAAYGVALGLVCWAVFVGWAALVG